MKIKLVKNGKAKIVDIDHIEAIIGTAYGEAKAKIQIRFGMPNKKTIQVRGIRSAFFIEPLNCNVVNIIADPR